MAIGIWNLDNTGFQELSSGTRSQAVGKKVVQINVQGLGVVWLLC